MKTKTKWVCQECGFQASKAMGRCTECSAWNSFVEEFDTSKQAEALPLRARGGFAQLESAGPSLLSELDEQDEVRYSTGFPSLDEVLGGGIVPGAVILLAGDPGIGKSTLLLKLAGKLSSQLNTLYVSAEESSKQVLIRARRLGLGECPMLIDNEQNVATIQKQIINSKAEFAVIDSVQAVYHPEVESAPGSVSQVRESAGALVNLAKSRGVATVLVGHVTKEGSIAGPRVLEHMVDVVLQFEGDRSRHLRTVRAAKNRFGSTQELAIFSMADDGLVEIRNPSAIFLGPRLEKKTGERSPSGTAVIASCEGHRALMLEVQSLVCASSLASPRRIANGFDTGRLLQILAVLEKRVGLPVGKQDVYVNIVGGMECNDPGGDLGVAVAVATSCMDRSVDPQLICVGEVGLTGEIRSVVSLERRLREAQSMGFKRAIIPHCESGLKSKFKDLEIVEADSLTEALEKAMPGLTKPKQRNNS
ncbi:MAG: DNA repair protein RadA [Candidatus Obscuribacterales bacterium]|nr:DNA repair protein RadA [Candidatus Obscuribacterales bacterium]